MSGKHLNDISKVYLDTIANVKKAETDADIKRWEDLGGPTPGNYRADDNSAKLKEGRRLRKSDWRQDLKEVIDKPETEEKAEKKVDEKKGIKNKIVINPTFKEAIQEIGGELLEVNEVDSVQKTQDDTQKKQEQHKKQLEQKQKKVAAMKKLVLRKKMQAVGAGGGEDITAGYEPEGDQLDERLGGKGYKPYTSLTGKKVSGDWEDSDRGAGNKAKKRAGGKVEKKSPTYRAYVLNKEEVIAEKDLNAAERRALPDSDFALPGKGEGPKGKQAGSYPIPDEKHARSALSLVAQHGTPAEKATVRAKVKKKFPNIEQSESVVLDANKKLQKKDDRKKLEKEYVRLMKVMAHKKRMKELGLGEEKDQVESFEIDKTEHKKKQKERKMRNLSIGNPNKNEADVAHKKAGGPKLAFEGWREKARDAMKRVVGKKDAPKHDFGRDAGAEAKKRLRKKDHETVNFLDPDD